VTKKRHISFGERICVSFTARERTLVLKETFAGSELTDPLEAARPVNGRYSVRYTLDDIDDLLGYVAAEANHATDMRVQEALDWLYERLEKVMSSYDDGASSTSPRNVAQTALASGAPGTKLKLVRGAKKP
jgi:hypothetical protein